MIDDKMPGTEIAAETSAAMASSSIVFRGVDRAYARRLLNKAKLVFHHKLQLFCSVLEESKSITLLFFYAFAAF